MENKVADKKWFDKNPQEQTLAFIEHIDKAYYKSYLEESERYERLNFRFHISVVILGFLVTIAIGIKKIFQVEDPCVLIFFDMVTLVLPSVSSVLMLYISQRGYKKKEEIRENARIDCKHLVNEARLRYSLCKTDEAYTALYRWLNDEIKRLQLSQAGSYFNSENLK